MQKHVIVYNFYLINLYQFLAFILEAITLRTGLAIIIHSDVTFKAVTECFNHNIIQYCFLILFIKITLIVEEFFFIFQLRFVLYLFGFRNRICQILTRIISYLQDDLQLKEVDNK